MSRKKKHTEKSTLANLDYLNDCGKISLNPRYQREGVWKKSQKQLLIDSLINDFDIPKLYFREIDKDGFEYEVVDGQQRLRSVFEFFKGKFNMPDDADEVDGNAMRNLGFAEFATPLQMKLRNVELDIVFLNEAHTDDDIEEMFLRLQNGTPLKAAEKRRAISGSMRDVVKYLSEHNIFSKCEFTNKHFAHEDAAAKITHLRLSNSITDLKEASLKKTYESNKTITATHPQIVRIQSGFNFLNDAFKKIDRNPKLKKFAILTLTYLVMELLDEYNLRKFPKEFAQSYINFEVERRKNEELQEEDQDTRLAAYTNAARSDSIQDMRYRHEVIRDRIIRDLPELVLKDPTRTFSNEQRMAIFWRDDGTCQICGAACDEGDFHADHITPHDNGGQTKISNGQVLCVPCNLKKSNKSSSG